MIRDLGKGPSRRRIGIRTEESRRGRNSGIRTPAYHGRIEQWLVGLLSGPQTMSIRAASELHDGDTLATKAQQLLEPHSRILYLIHDKL